MAADPVPIESQPDAATKTAGQPLKKRRRRTTAGGAADDCFACRKRGVRCDRKRPYCSQCIDSGKDCSGYKTTLTWGVGVASRGKLRGLACPVANKNVDGTNLSPSDLQARRRKSSNVRIKREDGNEPTQAPSYLHSTLTSHAAFNGPTSMPVLAQSYPPPTSPHSAAGWAPAHTAFAHPQPIPHTEGFFQAYRHPSLQRIQTDFASPFDGYPLSGSASSVGSFPDDARSSLDYARTPDSSVFADHMNASRFSPFGEPHHGNGPAGSFEPRSSIDSYISEHMSTSLDSLSSVASYVDNATPVTGPQEVDPIDHMMFQSNDLNQFNVFDPIEDNEAIAAESPELHRFEPSYIHLTPRLASLLQYYDQEICPQLVTFDGPENPYRKYILPLATQNEGLQNAIAALVTNNLRMKRRSQANEMPLAPELCAIDADEPSPEEQLYKKMSIEQLNLQLLDANSAQDDGVLATLLVLCLFHVCDSGFSKFKTQLSGMQKLLSLRQNRPQSGLAHWVEMFFAWFDVFTSTVNDRELQFKSETLDVLEDSAAPGMLEQFSGCDFKLFKTLARLGRLNVLAQGRPVRNSSKLERAQSMAHVPTLEKQQEWYRKLSTPSRYPLNRSISAQDYSQIDGNGWGSPILKNEPEEQDSRNDTRAEFWTEWHEVRRELRLWQMNPAFNPPPSQAAVLDPLKVEMGKQDLVHINECLRLAALLYTERLGFPLLPSSHEQFQSLVSQAFYHIANLSSSSSVSKFMLWPLFIVGTECVDEGHRHFLRTRCVEIQGKSGFSNNLATLEVLERLWRELPGGTDIEMEARRRCSAGDSDGRPGQPFIWRKMMNRFDGEYLVV